MKLRSKPRRLSTVAVVDSVAEITRYLDRELIERSLLATLADFDSQQELRLYKVITVEPEIELGLVGHHYKGTLLKETENLHHDIEFELAEGIAEAVETGDMASMDDPETHLLVNIYPIFDRDGDLYSLLVQMCEHMSQEAQRLIHGLLKIYTNYLSLLDLSQKDKLTSLLNRDRLYDSVMQLLLCQRRPGVPDVPESRRADDGKSYWLAVIDIDHFKSVNDSYGHLIGDEVLIAFARLMNMVFRGEDKLFRFGGEEFVALIEVDRREHAKSTFERFRSNCEEHDFPVIGRLTASLGVVEVGTQQEAADVIEAADQAMYWAKQQGRNRIAFHDELIASGELTPKQLPEPGDIDLF